jgi:hypothetical protein
MRRKQDRVLRAASLQKSQPAAAAAAFYNRERERVS